MRGHWDGEFTRAHRALQALQELSTKRFVERLGTPQKDDLAQIENAQAVQYITGLASKAAATSKTGAGLKDLFPDAPPACVDLLEQLLQFSPGKRPTAGGWAPGRTTLASGWVPKVERRCPAVGAGLSQPAVLRARAGCMRWPFRRLWL